MSDMEIVSDASDAGALVPWNLLQEQQEREVEPAAEESTEEVVTAGLQQTSLHRFGQATLRTTLGTSVPIAGPVKKVQDADLPFACRFCSQRFRTSQGRHGHERQTHEVLFTEAQRAGCATVSFEPQPPATASASSSSKPPATPSASSSSKPQPEEAGSQEEEDEGEPGGKATVFEKSCSKTLLNISTQFLSDSFKWPHAGTSPKRY